MPRHPRQDRTCSDFRPMIKTALSSFARLKSRSPVTPWFLAVAENVQHSVASKTSLSTSSHRTSRPSGCSLAHGNSSGFQARHQWVAPSDRLFYAGQRANFHFSARYFDRRPTYTRFGGRSSNSGIFENLAARFSDPGTRMMIFIVVGLGGKRFILLAFGL